MISEDIGVAEDGATAVGESLQRVGTGDSADDFTWAAPAAETPSAENTGQTLEAPGGGTSPSIIVQDEGAVTVREDGGTDTFTLNTATTPNALVTVTVSAGDGQTLVSTDNVTFSASIPVELDGTGPVTVYVQAVDDPDVEGTPHAGEITFSVASADAAYNGLAVSPQPVSIEDNDIAITKIHEIQGAGDTSPLVGSDVTVEAVVTGLLTSSSGVTGFFLQEEDADVDADTATSEGIFVFNPNATVTVGDWISISATVVEFFGNTELTNPSDIQILSSGNALPTVTMITIGSDAEYEAVEGMLVQLVSGGTDPLTVIENFNLDRFGQVTVSEGKQFQPTQLFDPATQQAEIQALADANAQNRLIIDDSRTDQNPDVFALIDSGDGSPLQVGDTIAADGPTLRLGSEMASITGIMDQRFGDYRVQTDTPLDVLPGTGERPDGVPPVSGKLQVASFNVLNFFTTLGEANNGTGPNGDQNPRGADNADEYTRQLDKLVAALTELDAEVIGLQELENNGFGTDSAIAALVDALNAYLGDTVYAFVDPGTGFVGSDAITTGIIYKHDAVTLKGSAVLVFEEPSADATFAAADALQQVIGGNRVEDFDRNRPAVAATFKDADGSEFTVAVNHFKSKGDSGLEDLAEAAINANAPLDLIADLIRDPNFDQGDGQGFWNQVRTDAALELAKWLHTNPTGACSPENLVVLGDLNAYAQEDPVQALIDAGFIDLAQTLIGPEAYSFVFDGQQGTLDYAMTSAGLYDNVTWVGEWHIAADEPDLLSYDTRFTDPAFYNVDPFRASDHDPVVFGLELDDPTVNARYEFVSNPKTHQDKVKYFENGQRIDVEKISLPKIKLDLDDLGLLIDAHDGMRGWEKLTIDRSGLGVWSKNGDLKKHGGGHNPKDTKRVDDGEAISFNLDDGAGLGDALEVEFQFRKVKGSGDVTLRFFDDQQLVEKLDLTIVDGQVGHDLYGNTSFDEVKITARDNTKFQITAVEFERLMLDDTFDYV
jgi:predicted extracellular nuclease